MTVTHRGSARPFPARRSLAAAACVLALAAAVSAPVGCAARPGPAPVGETVRTDAGPVRGVRSGPHLLFRG
ncbi:carboxylesterase, partial [Streptomyces virginiae]